MSYAAGLLPTTTYSSTLLSDAYVQRSSFETMYPSSMSYMNNTNTNRLYGNDLSYDSHPSMAYGQKQSNGYNPKAPPPGGNKWASSTDLPDPLPSMNDITEYSESMGTASNTNTASSVARTIDDPYGYAPTKKPSQYPANPMWNQKPAPPPPTMTTQKKKVPFDESKRVPQHPPATVTTTKKPPLDRSRDDSTPVQDAPSRAVNIEAWLNESKNTLPSDDHAAQQAWSDKINQLHMVQAQREKDKIKSSRELRTTTTTKRFEPKSNGNPSRQNARNDSHDKHPGPYSHFDSLFDGDFYRPTNYSSYPNHPPAPKPKPKRPKPPPDFPLDEYSTKPTKYPPPSRTHRYEPPTSKRPPPGITTSSWRSHWPRHYLYDAHYPYYMHPEYFHPEYIHKDEEERYREALQVLRAERAEQQQRQISETTAKRLTYGDYVRNSTKEGSLPTTVKPSPWSDFMDLKKGNIYTIAREEKKQLYHQSRSYGERVRHRNVGLSDTDLALSHRASMPFPDDAQEAPPSNVTPRQTKHDTTSKSLSRTSRHRPDSGSTKRSNVQRNISNPDSRNNHHYRSDDDQGAQSDTGVAQKSKRTMKKRTVRYGKYDSSGRTTSGTEDSDTEVENRSVRSKARAKKDNLFTVREERTLESMEPPRQNRKATQKQKK